MAKPQPSFPFPYTKQCSPIVSLTIFGQCTQSVFPLLMLHQLKYFAVRKDIILMFYFDSVVCVCVSSYLCSSQTGPGPGPVPGGSGGSLPVSPGDVLPLHHGEGHPGTCSRPHRPQRHAHGELVNPICLCF